MEKLKIIGENALRVGALERLKGNAPFAADIRREGELALLVLRSDRPHARILSIDASEALSQPGCVAVFTARDIPGRNRLGIINKDQRLLADDKVRYVGDPVALVAAETLGAAERALSLIRVDYEDLPAVFDAEEALKEGAPLVHDKGNLLHRRPVVRGNADEALKKAAVVVENDYTTTFIEHTYLEPDAGCGYIEPDGVIVVYASTQNPHYDQKDVAVLLGLDENLVRIVQAATGGGFGSKLDLNVQGYIALAVHKLGRPARMVYTREEAYLATAKRHPVKIHCITGADENGKLVAVKARIIGNTGAYGSYGMAVATRIAVHITGPYEVPNVDVDAHFAYTNSPMCGAMRGFGVPQAAVAHESQMDLLAEKLNLSPVEIRRRNIYRVGSVTSSGQVLNASVGIGATLDAVAPRFEAARSETTEGLKPHLKRGVGVACMVYGIGNTAMQNPSTARVEMNRDGTVTVFTGAADIGQGSTTTLRQIAAEAMALRPEEIRMVVADTRYTTSAGATSASRQTYISGNAVLDAANKLKDVMLTERRHHPAHGARNPGVRRRKGPVRTGPGKDGHVRAHRAALPPDGRTAVVAGVLRSADHSAG